jgi:pimeloyl-ACP methyl ester carboxylesterase
MEVLDTIGVDGAVDWVGNAWGGHVGILAATEWPGVLRSLVTLGTPVRAYRPAERRQVRVLAMAYRILGPARFLGDGVAEVLLSPATRAGDDEAVALATEFLRSTDRRGLYNAIQSISIHREDLSSRLSAISIPTLFITGSDHSGFTPDEARAAIAQVPGGRVEILPDAAYLIPLEQPVRTAELVLEFWGRL